MMPYNRADTSLEGINSYALVSHQGSILVEYSKETECFVPDCISLRFSHRHQVIETSGGPNHMNGLWVAVFWKVCTILPENGNRHPAFVFHANDNQLKPQADCFFFITLTIECEE